MGKNSNIQELARLVGLAVAHSIGSILNSSSLYADKYRKEKDNFLRLAEKIKDREHWNMSDFSLIKKKSVEEAHYELSKREHLDSRKYHLIDEEVEKILRELNLVV